MHNIWFQIAPFRPFIPTVNIYNTRRIRIIKQTLFGHLQCSLKILRSIIPNGIGIRINLISLPWLFLIRSWSGVPTHCYVRIIRNAISLFHFFPMRKVLITHKERYKSFSLFPNAQSTDYAHGYSPFVAYPTAHDESIHKRLLNQSPALLLMQVYP